MWAVQPISFLWGYPAHILLVWVQPISLELSSPYSFGSIQPIFFWGCPAHILSLGLSSTYPFFGAIQPISFAWGCPAHIFSLELFSPYFCWCGYPFLGAIQPISFLWSYPAHILRAIQPISFLWSYPAYIFVGAGCPHHILSLGLSSPYSFGVGCPAYFFGAIHTIFFWVYPAHILLVLSSPYPSLKLSSPYSVGVGCPAHILSLVLSSPYSFGVGCPAHFFGAIQPIFFWVYPAHILLAISFPWGCPALYPFFGAFQPISFPWGCPANIFSLGLSSPYLFFW